MVHWPWGWSDMHICTHTEIHSCMHAYIHVYIHACVHRFKRCTSIAICRAILAPNFLLHLVPRSSDHGNHLSDRAMVCMDLQHKRPGGPQDSSTYSVDRSAPGWIPGSSETASAGNLGGRTKPHSVHGPAKRSHGPCLFLRVLAEHVVASCS